VVVFGALFYWCQIYLDNTAAEFNPKVYFAYKSVAAVDAANPRDENKIFIARGKAVYESVCFGCHQVNGLGTAGQFPPLTGSEWVTAPGPNRLIRIPLHGLTGPITVSGSPWNLEMGPFGADLPNEDLAAVLTYIRQAWGNNAPPVTPEQVAAVRQETASRPPIGAPWTAEELLKLPDSL
jgi:mono/diheme cytochrome c family protein